MLVIPELRQDPTVLGPCSTASLQVQCVANANILSTCVMCARDLTA